MYSYSSAGGEDKTTTSPEKGREGQERGWVAVRGWLAVRGKGVADVWRPFTRFRRGAAGEEGKEVWVMWILMGRG